MAVTKFQPNLPAPLPFTEAELNFHDEEPPRIFPENQNSNWGLIRRNFSNRMQQLINQVTFLYSEMFIDTSTDLLDKHEFEVGLPQASSALTLQQRRERVKSRLATGPFTEQRIRDLVESFIFATYGDAIQFSPAGVALTAGGVPFFSGEAGSLSSLYRVYEDYRNFSYEVWIKNTVGPDTAALLRELNRITPAGIALTLDTTKVDVLSYFRTIRNLQPQGYWQMDNSPADISGNGNNGTFGGAPANVATLISAAAGGGSAMSFNGTTQYMTVPDAASLDLSGMQPFSIETWVNATVDGGFRRIVSKENGADGIALWVQNASGFGFERRIGSAYLIANYLPAVMAGVHHVVATYDSANLKLYVDGVLRSTVADARSIPALPVTLDVGRQTGGAPYYSGVIDDTALYSFALSQAQISEHYNTGRDIP